MSFRTESWDDLRHFLAAARGGSLSAAARAMRVEHTTVGRRLSALEKALGAKLFLRGGRGLRLTKLGERLARVAARMEGEVDRIGRLALASGEEPDGPVRLATSDLLAAELVAPRMGDLVARHPGLSLELVADTPRVGLAKRSADLALRLGRPADDRLVGRKVAAIAFAPYASAAWSPQRRQSFRTAPLLLLDDREVAATQETGLLQRFPKARVVLRSNRLHTIWAAARAGAGVALLPCFVGESDPLLVRLGGKAERSLRELWLVVDAEVKDSARVRSARAFVAEVVKARIGELRGEPRRAPKAALARVPKARTASLPRAPKRSRRPQNPGTPRRGAKASLKPTAPRSPPAESRRPRLRPAGRPAPPPPRRPRAPRAASPRRPPSRPRR